MPAAPLDLPLSIVVTIVTSAAVVAAAWGMQRATVARQTTDLVRFEGALKEQIGMFRAELKEIEALAVSQNRELRAEVRRDLEAFANSRDKMGRRIGSVENQLSALQATVEVIRDRDGEISRPHRIPRLPAGGRDDRDDSGKVG